MSRRWTGILALAVAGCGGIDLEQTGDVPLGSVSDERIEMPVGLAVGVLLEDADDDETSDFVSRDPTIMDAAPSDNLHEFVVFAVSEGSTVIDVFINGETKGEIEAVVTAYPSSDAP